MITEPILVIAFNRPDHLKVLIDRLREVQPTRIYFAVDGPREGNEAEKHKVTECQEMVSDIDWGCEIVTNFQKSKLTYD